MTALETITTARAAGVELWRTGDRLRYRGPRRALTPERQTAFAEHKAAILEELRQREWNPTEALRICRQLIQAVATGGEVDPRHQMIWEGICQRVDAACAAQDTVALRCVTEDFWRSERRRLEAAAAPAAPTTPGGVPREGSLFDGP